VGRGDEPRDKRQRPRQGGGNVSGVAFGESEGTRKRRSERREQERASGKVGGAEAKGKEGSKGRRGRWL